MNKTDIIKTLGLTEHREGGYFSRTYCSPLSIETDRTPPTRWLMTSIYYLLTDDRPIGHFHRNKSDILHYFHLGSPITYLIIHPAGELEKVVMGSDLLDGHRPQLLVKSGCWKASILESGDYGLISEAVAPGFEYEDSEIADSETLKSTFPHLWGSIAACVAKY